MKVPFLNLRVQYDGIREEVNAAIQQVLDSTAFAGGPAVAAFEEDYARFCGTKHCVGVGNGTDALWVAMIGLGIGAGDEVITAANTFIATAEAITYAGAKPVFVDVEPETFNMDPAKLEAAITKKTKAIIPVHLYGQMADMEPILEIAKNHKLHVIEDASQAQGAEYKGRRAGSMGIAGCFSFYPGKNLGAFGEAGAVVTNDDELAARMRRFRDHGQSKKYYHDEIGWNARMDGIQGAVLKVKLKYLEGWNESRRRNARLYDELLADADGVKLPREASYAKHIYHIYPIRTADRDALIAQLAERDIACGIHYPVPIHLQKAYASLKLGEETFPVCEAIAKELVSLPMFPELSEEQVRHVAAELKNCLNAREGAGERRSAKAGAARA